MNWSDLPIFLAVAKSGQLARAADELGTDATTVARRLKKLEQALGYRLFVKSGRSQSLTAAGLELLQRADAMARLAAGISGTGESEEALSGTLRINSPEGFATWYLCPRLQDFSSLHPSLRVELSINATGGHNLLRREADVALSFSRPNRGPYRARMLTKYSMGWYAAKGYLGGSSEIRALNDLELHSIVGYTDDIVYSRHLASIDGIGYPARPRLACSSIVAQLSLIRSGAGVGVLPSYVTQTEQGVVRILDELKIVRELWLVMHQDTAEFPAIRAFVEWLAAECRRDHAVLSEAG